jgi:hypothetical protein
MNFDSKTCLIYLIADAPSHGIQYHDLGGKKDSYAKQPSKTLEGKM